MNIDNKLIYWLFVLKKRTGLFIWKKSIVGLGDFISGFCFGVDCIEKSSEYCFLNSLNLYIKEKYRISDSNSIYIRLLNLANENEERAFDLFFEELEAYLNASGIEIPEIK